MDVSSQNLTSIGNGHSLGGYLSQSTHPRCKAFSRYAEVVEKRNKEVSSGLAVILLPLSNRKIAHRHTFESMGFTKSQFDFLTAQGYEIPAVQKRIHEGFSPDEIFKAVSLKIIHDKVEIAAYSGLQKGICEMGLTRSEGKTLLTDEQSKKLLHDYIKKTAHVVMRSPQGYTNVRGQYLNQKQIAPVFSKVGWIASDRDSKLTNATYHTFEELLSNLDEHNTEVNNILFNAWGVPSHPLDHLTTIKNKAGFTGIET